MVTINSILLLNRQSDAAQISLKTPSAVLDPFVTLTFFRSLPPQCDRVHIMRLKSGVSYKVSRDYRVLIIRTHAIGIKCVFASVALCNRGI